MIAGERTLTRGTSEYRTEDGGHVRRLDPARYQVIASGVVLVPIDPQTVELVPGESTPEGPTG